MKHTCCLLFSFIFLSFFLTVAGVAQPAAIDSVITAEKLKAVVYQLAHDSMEGRLTNKAGCEAAATIIATRMQAAGIRRVKGLNGYFEDLGEAYQDVRNVIGVLPGTGSPNQLVVISAHYDHIGMADASASGGDVIFNGANDDASGVAVMLSLAEWFARREHSRTILFVAFSGEEIGMYGSKGFCSHFFPDSIIAQINLEMLGRSDVYKRPFITGYQHSNLRDLLNRALKDTLHTQAYFETDNNDRNQLFVRSDNYPLALKGVPAHSIMLSTDRDRYYHTVHDEASTLDYGSMCTIARNIALALEPLVQAQVTPRRIKPRTISAVPGRYYR